MNEKELLSLIASTPELKALADAGQDAALSDAINADIPAAVPITIESLTTAAPTLFSVASDSPSPLSELSILMGLVASQNVTSLSTITNALLYAGKIPQKEADEVVSLIELATRKPVEHVSVSKVLREFREVVVNDEVVERKTSLDWTAVEAKAVETIEAIDATPVIAK